MPAAFSRRSELLLDHTVLSHKVLASHPSYRLIVLCGETHLVLLRIICYLIIINYRVRVCGLFSMQSRWQYEALFEPRFTRIHQAFKPVSLVSSARQTKPDTYAVIRIVYVTDVGQRGLRVNNFTTVAGCSTHSGARRLHLPRSQASMARQLASCCMQQERINALLLAVSLAGQRGWLARLHVACDKSWAWRPGRLICFLIIG